MKRVINLIFIMFLIGSAYLVFTGQTTKMLKIYMFIFLFIVLIIWWVLSLITSLIGLGDIPMPKAFWDTLHEYSQFIHEWAKD